MTNTSSRIIYTFTDEAPALATYSFLPIIKTFARACDVAVRSGPIDPPQPREGPSSTEVKLRVVRVVVQGEIPVANGGVELSECH